MQYCYFVFSLVIWLISYVGRVYTQHHFFTHSNETVMLANATRAYEWPNFSPRCVEYSFFVCFSSSMYSLMEVLVLNVV